MCLIFHLKAEVKIYKDPVIDMNVVQSGTHHISKWPYMLDLNTFCFILSDFNFYLFTQIYIE